MTDIFADVHNSENPLIGSNMRGEYGETIVRLMFIQKGWRVSAASSNYPYDFIVDRHDDIRRVQVKTVHRSDVANFKASDDFDTAAIVLGDGSIYVMPRSAMHFTSGGRDPKRLKFRLTAEHKAIYRVAKFRPIEMAK